MNEQTPGALKSTPLQTQRPSLRQRHKEALGQRSVTGGTWTERLPDADVRYQPTQQGAPNKVRLWDCVDSTWTSLVDESHAYKYYLKKAVFKCSHCSFADQRIGSVEGHLARVSESAAIHQRATIDNQKLDNGYVALACSACSQTFQARPSQAYSHIFDVEQEATAHQYAVSQTIRRFSLEPVELPSPAIVQHTNGDTQHPGTGVGEELRVRSVHKRKRGKRGGRKHG